MESSVEPKISLLNFEDCQFEDSSYILTSPRSLEACSRLNIKPIEILGRELEDFRDELLPRGLSVRSIVEIYNEYERERQNKLQLCLEERRHIIAENSEYFYDSKSDDDSLRFTYDKNSVNVSDEKVPNDVVTFGRRPTVSVKSKDRTKHVKPLRNLSHARGLEKSHSSTRKLSHKPYKPNKADMNLRLDRITRDAERKLDSLGQSLTDSGISSDSKKSRRREWRSQSALDCNSERDAFSETGSVASSRLSSRSCLTDVTYVTDPLLKRKLHSSLNSQTRIRAKDQKILSVLLQKKEQVKEAAKQREQCHIRWEEDKQRHRQERHSKENQRRLSLAKERNRINEIRTEVEGKRLQRDEEQRRERELELEDHIHIAASESCRRQQMMKFLKLKEQQIQQFERKKSVDLRLEQQRKAADDYQDLLRMRQEAELRRASSLKLSKEQEQATRMRMKNKQAKEKHEEKMTVIKQRSLDDLALLRKSLDYRDNIVERHISQQRRQKETKIHEQQKELEKKIEQSRKNQIEIEDEIQDWRTKLMDYHHMQEARATEAARNTVIMKSEKAQKKRMYHGKMQKENMKQIVQQEDQWRRDMEAAIHLKQLKIQNILEDRDKMIHESRNLAGVSERLRSRLKEHYSTADLDELNRKAQIENKILFRPRPRTTVQLKSDNISRLLIG